MKRWYAVHTQTRGEETALRNLERQGFDAYLPTLVKERRHARRVDAVRAPLFPRYLFVAFDAASCQWRSINGTLGVSYLITNGLMPAALPDDFMPALKMRETENHLQPVAAPRFAFGEAVRIACGAYADLIGKFERMADAERVVLMLSLLGRELRATVDINAVASAQ